MTAPTTGTIYALTDPRDGVTRYIGQTKATLAQRLRGHLTSTRTAPRVRAWIGELQAAGLTPGIEPIREGVPVSDLREAEEGEITRIIAAGASLLNEQSTARGRKLDAQRREAAREAAERAGWARLAGAAIDLLGGPMPPGELACAAVPDACWQFMASTEPGHHERVNALIDPFRPAEIMDETRGRWWQLSKEQKQIGELLWQWAQNEWCSLRRAGRDDIDDNLKHYAWAALENRCSTPAEAARLMALIPWYVAAVHPWRRLAEIAGLPLDDESFIAWAGRDPGTREALTFLARSGDGLLRRLAIQHDHPEYRFHPQSHLGWLLGTVTAAYTGITPDTVTGLMLGVLKAVAKHHMLTRPMADLLLRLKPDVLDEVFGRDIAAMLDVDLNLPDGTAGRVLREFIKHIGHTYEPALRRAADRSTRELPVVKVPDYVTWRGNGVPGARAIGALLVHAGLTEPSFGDRESYLAEFREFWTERRERRLAA